MKTRWAKTREEGSPSCSRLYYNRRQSCHGREHASCRRGEFSILRIIIKSLITSLLQFFQFGKMYVLCSVDFCIQLMCESIQALMCFLDRMSHEFAIPVIFRISTCKHLKNPSTRPSRMMMMMSCVMNAHTHYFFFQHNHNHHTTLKSHEDSRRSRPSGCIPVFDRWIHHSNSSSSTFGIIGNSRKRQQRRAGHGQQEQGENSIAIEMGRIAGLRRCCHWRWQ